MNKYLLLAYTIAAGILVTACKSESADQIPEFRNDVAAAENEQSENEFFTVRTEVAESRIKVSGRLRAEKRLEIFPEVPGKVMEREKPFREGVSYQEGEVIVQLNDKEARMQLQSSRSKFKTLISGLMADINLDFPEMLPQYKEWYHSLAADRQVFPVPDFGEGLQRFMESKGVYELYYSIKSAEERLEKYTILAPFSGVLSAVKADPNQVVGPQYHMGTFVDPSLMILNAAVDHTDTGWIQPGMTLAVTSRDQVESYNAEIVRVNPSVDPTSQQVLLYMEVSGNNLREGMYLEGEIGSGMKRELARIPRSSLLRTGAVIAKRDGVLTEVTVEIHELERNHLWVSGLQNGDEIVVDVSEPVSGRMIN